MGTAIRPGPDTRDCPHGTDHLKVSRTGRTYCHPCKVAGAKHPARMRGEVARMRDRIAAPIPPAAGVVADGAARAVLDGNTFDHWTALRPEPDPNPPPRLSPLFGCGLEMPVWDAPPPPPPPPPEPPDVPMRPCRAGTHQIPWTAPRCRLCAVDYHRGYMQRRRAREAATQREVAS